MESLPMWRALRYSGSGVISSAVRYLLKKQNRAGKSVDLTAMKSDDFSGFKYRSRVMLARATAIRAYALEQHL